MYRIHSFSKQITKSWSGGTTTQLFISPKDSEFTERNFDFRISTATVDQEKSDFTPLPGFSRFLMVLEGELEIIHENRYSKYLKQFDSDSFEGFWSTESIGKVRDFNVIYKPGLKVEINFRSESKINVKNQSSFHFLLVLNDFFQGNFDFKKYDLIEIQENFELDSENKLVFLEIQIEEKDSDRVGTLSESKKINY